MLNFQAFSFAILIGFRKEFTKVISKTNYVKSFVWYVYGRILPLKFITPVQSYICNLSYNYPAIIRQHSGNYSAIYFTFILQISLNH